MTDLQSLKIDRKPKKSAAHKRRGGGSPWFWRLGALALVGGAVWLFWQPLTSFADRVRLPTVRTFLVTEAAPSAAAAVRGTSANGYLVAARRAALSSDVPGRIVELNVQEGSVVKSGDVVARLFADDFRAAYVRSEADLAAAETAILRAEAAQRTTAAELEQARSALATAEAQRDEAQAQLTFAESELVRFTELATTGIEGPRRQQQATSERDAAKARLLALKAAVVTSRAAVTTVEQRLTVAAIDIDAAKAGRDAAKAARDQAKATLDKTDVRAPFDGIVVLKDAEVGEVVSPNAQGGSNARGAVCTMVDFDSLEVQANVPETALASVALGAPADVFLDAWPDERYAGRVDRIWPTADRQKATVEVRIKLRRKDERLRPEMGVRIVFRQDLDGPDDAPDASEPLAAQRRIVVPTDALVQIDGVTGAFVVERDTVRFAAVTAGETKNGRVAIDAGLAKNQRIVLAPPSSLQDGDRIRLEGP